MRISIDLTDEEVKILNKRGRKNYLSLREQIEDIVRRSCINSKRKGTTGKFKTDDSLIELFSRQTRGRARKG